MTAYLCAIFMVAGAILYIIMPTAPPLGTKEKVAEMARLAYFAGMLVFLWMLAGEVVKLLPGR